MRLASMVAPVIGFEPRRGDILQIENVSFAGKGQIVPLLLAAALAGLAVWGLNFFRGRRRRQEDGGKNTVWKTLENTDAEALAAYLSGESPSVAAYVLLRLNRPTAETVLNGLPLPFAAGVLAAMAVSALVVPEIAAEIERTLSRDFAQSVPNGANVLLPCLPPRGENVAGSFCRCWKRKIRCWPAGCGQQCLILKILTR